jgi:hypothetical protein
MGQKAKAANVQTLERRNHLGYRLNLNQRNVVTLMVYKVQRRLFF